MTWPSPPKPVPPSSRHLPRIARRLGLVIVVCVVSGFAPGVADVPHLPSSGVYGATAGAGSLTGWSRHGGSPAAAGAPGWSASWSGYAPFGLEGLRVHDVAVARDGTHLSAAVEWRHLADDAGPNASRVRVLTAWRARWGSAGAFVSGHDAGLNSSRDGARDAHFDEGFGAGAGVIVRPHALLTLGLEAEAVPASGRRFARVGVGADAGTSLARVLGRGAAWRVSVEHFRELNPASGVDAGEWRYALGLRLHALLGVYGGYAPRAGTLALGVGFGAGGWRGYSAVRRHGALGGTVVQGVEWSSAGSGL